MVLVPRGRLLTLMLTAPLVRARFEGSAVRLSEKLTEPVGIGVPLTCAVRMSGVALGTVVPRLEAMVTLAVPVPAWTTFTVRGAEVAVPAEPVYLAVNWWAPALFMVKLAATLFFPAVRFLVPAEAGVIAAPSRLKVTDPVGAVPPFRTRAVRLATWPVTTVGVLVVSCTESAPAAEAGASERATPAPIAPAPTARMSSIARPRAEICPNCAIRGTPFRRTWGPWHPVRCRSSLTPSLVENAPHGAVLRPSFTPRQGSR